MNRYRVVKASDGWPDSLPYRVGWVGHPDDYGVGEEFDREFDTPEEERDCLATGIIEIVPREYRVIAPDSEVHGAKTGETFKAGLPIEQEAALIQGGHIERVEQKPPTKKGSKD